MAMVPGRPKMISDNDCDTQAPLDCSIPADPSKPVPMAVTIDGQGTQPSSVAASLITYSVSTKFHEVRAQKLDRPYPRDFSGLRRIQEEVLSILDNVTLVLGHRNPDTSKDSQYTYLPLQREEILTIVYTFITALHRPHIAARVESRDTASQAAIVILDSQQRPFEQMSKHHYKLCLLSFYTVDAAIILSVITEQCPPQSSERKHEIDPVYNQCIQRLSLMAPSDPTAKSGLEVLSRCHENLLQSGRLSPVRPDAALLSQSIIDSQAVDAETSTGSNDVAISERNPLDMPPETLGNLTWDETEVSTNSFDESNWLQLIDSMDAADNGSILKLVSESHCLFRLRYDTGFNFDSCQRLRRSSK